MKKKGLLFFHVLSFVLSFITNLLCWFLVLIFQGDIDVNAKTIDLGKQIFFSNCIICHYQGNNIIIPEKNLRKETLEANGMNTISSITYQVLNGKNGMPAFGGKLNEIEIEQVAIYVLEESKENFKDL